MKELFKEPEAPGSLSFTLDGLDLDWGRDGDCFTISGKNYKGGEVNVQFAGCFPGCFPEQIFPPGRNLNKQILITISMKELGD